MTLQNSKASRTRCPLCLQRSLPRKSNCLRLTHSRVNLGCKSFFHCSVLKIVTRVRILHKTTRFQDSNTRRRRRRQDKTARLQDDDGDGDDKTRFKDKTATATTRQDGDEMTTRLQDSKKQGIPRIGRIWGSIQSGV